MHYPQCKDRECVWEGDERKQSKGGTDTGTQISTEQVRKRLRGRKRHSAWWKEYSLIFNREHKIPNQRQEHTQGMYNKQQNRARGSRNNTDW